MIIDNKAIDKINYTALNDRQKETYNFQQVSAVLAQYGFATIKLNDDWQGADFIAQHINGELFLKSMVSCFSKYSLKAGLPFLKSIWEKTYTSPSLIMEVGISITTIHY